MNHICIFTSAHPIDDVRVHTKVARSFVDAGWKVSWVGPGHAFFADEAWRDKDIDYHLTHPIESRLDRLLSLWRSRRILRSMTNVDWIYSPDPDAAGAAAKFALRANALSVFDVHEVFHGALLDRWLPFKGSAQFRELVRRRIAATARRSDLVIGVSESVLRPYCDQHPHAFPVRNCAPKWFAKEVDVPRAEPGGITRFMHGKGLSNNGTSVLLKALALRSDSGGRAELLVFPASRKGGPHFMPDLVTSISSLGVGDAVILENPVTHSGMPRVLAKCNVGVIAYGRGLGEDSLPNRLFEYMASGLAILAPSYSSEIRRIVETEDIGVTADFDDPADVATKMQWMIDNPQEVAAMGKRARTAFMARYSWEAQFEVLLEAMNSHSGVRRYASNSETEGAR